MIIECKPIPFGVFGPVSSVDNEVPRFDGTTGKKIQAGTGVYIDDSGQVGIGTTGPDSKLSILTSGTGAVFRLEKSDTTGAGIILKRNSATASGFIDFTNSSNSVLWQIGVNTLVGSGIEFNEAGNNLMFIKSGGNVGIGTTAPGYLLDVYKTGTDTYYDIARFRYYDTDNTALRYEALIGDGAGTYFKSLVTGSQTDFSVIDQDNAAGRLSFLVQGNAGAINSLAVESTGNVGIGTTNPLYKLQLAAPSAGSSAIAIEATNGTDAIRRISATGSGANFGWMYSSGAPYMGYGVRCNGATEGFVSSHGVTTLRSAVLAERGYISLFTGVSQGSTDGGAITLVEAMRVTGSNVGIGTTNPSVKLHVSGSDNTQIVTESGGTGWFGMKSRPAASGDGMLYWNSGNSLRFGITTNVDGATDWSEKVRITTDGNVGIGAVSPDQRLEIEQTETLAASPADGYSAALRLDPGYSGAYTVTRHNYIDFQDVSLAVSAVVTNAAAMRFNAAMGTHKATAAAFQTTDSDSNTTDWAGGIIVNVDGTLYKIPLIAV
uniref:Putative tail fiber-like protein n=1 Tax=viral metagenome TaxID=1070528 RepID=A0A6M3IIM3_9ZZZZ